MIIFVLFLIAAFIALFFIFHNTTDPLLGVVAIFILAWLLWYSTGGVERFEDSNKGIFIKPTKNYQDFETYGKFPELPTSKSE